MFFGSEKTSNQRDFGVGISKVVPRASVKDKRKRKRPGYRVQDREQGFEWGDFVRTVRVFTKKKKSLERQGAN